MRLAGIDLAWESDKNTTAVAIGDLEGTSLRISRIEVVHSLEKLKALIQEEDRLIGIAIDAPLIIKNDIGQRKCETSLSSHYSRYKVSCHSSNLHRYPNAASVRLSGYLKEQGYEHLQNVSEGLFQIECYPHPAIVEIFGLKERLKYKKGNVSLKKQGQIKLSKYILSLRESRVASLLIDKKWQNHITAQHIKFLAGATLKTNEDILDSIICLYICALFTISVPHQIYGSRECGYIYVPSQKCTL